MHKGGESALPDLPRGLMTGDGFDIFIANGADEVLLDTTFQKAPIDRSGLQNYFFIKRIYSAVSRSG